MKENKKMLTILTLFGIKEIHDHVAIIKKLHAGTDVDTVDSGGRTLLMEAVIKRDHELINILINNGADVNIRDKRNWTALHFAAQEYDLLSTQKLVQGGANVDAQDDYGNSVISRAVFNSRGRGDVIQVLLNHGADVNIKNNSGISALDLAKRISNYDIVQFFQ